MACDPSINLGGAEEEGGWREERRGPQVAQGWRNTVGGVEDHLAGRI